MKNKNLLFLSSLILLAVFFFGCSKETPVTGDKTTSAVIKYNNDVTNTGARLAPRHYGSVIGILMPAPVKARIIAFNDQSISGEAICDQDGSFELTNLVAGSYIIRVDYVPLRANDYFSITIPKVVVTAGTVTNLGIINLE